MTGHIEGIHSLEGFRQTPSLLMVDVMEFMPTRTRDSLAGVFPN